MFGNFSGEGKCLETGQRKKSCSTSSKAWLPWPSKRNRSWTIVFIWACVSLVAEEQVGEYNPILIWHVMSTSFPAVPIHPALTMKGLGLNVVLLLFPTVCTLKWHLLVWMDSVILTCVYDMFPQAPETLHSSLSGLHQWDCWFAAEWGWSWNRSFSNVYRRL